MADSASGSSNVDQVGAWLDQLVAEFNFTVPGKDQSLGRDLAGIVASGIAARSAQSQAPDGSTWAPNSDKPPAKYRSRKKRLYQVDQPNIRTGQMLSIESLLGDVTITEDEVEMRYGTGEPPASGSTGYISKQDKEVTDREKAGWCSKERPFFALDDEIRDDCGAETRDVLGDYLQKGP